MTFTEKRIVGLALSLVALIAVAFLLARVAEGAGG